MKLLFPTLLTLGACSPSPLYVDRAQLGTHGEVPRDSRGEPIWSAIGPVPTMSPQPFPQPMPQAAPGPTQR